MATINLFIANASGRFSKAKPSIESAFDRAREFAAATLNLTAIDIICVDTVSETIPETGVSGYTPSQNLVYLYIDASRNVSEDEIFYTLCHELSHAKRYAGPSYGTTLFDSMIFEGLGVAIEDEVSKGGGSFLSNYLSDHYDDSLLRKVVPHFETEDFDRQYWFIQESDNLSRWTGYTVGYHIVYEYVKKTKKRASQLLLEAPDVFREITRTISGERSHED